MGFTNRPGSHLGNTLGSHAEKPTSEMALLTVKLTPAESELVAKLMALEKKEKYGNWKRKVYASKGEIVRQGLLAMARKHRLLTAETTDKLESDRRKHPERRRRW